MAALTRDSLVSRRPGFVEGVVDGEVLFLNQDKGICHGLNRTASRVWALIGGGAKVGDICARLAAEYRVGPQTCERQVLDLLEELRVAGLVEAP